MFRYFLNFLDLPLIGKIEISEPFGSDGQTHKITQEEGRYGRDNVKANEKIKLRFFKDNFEFIEVPQMSIDGVEFAHASHGFDYLVNLFETRGWESEVEYIIEKDGSSFTTGIIDFFTIDIKEDEIEFSIIQNTNREIIKRREDVYVDAFSDKDLDGNTIVPCSTSNILLKSKSIFKESEWEEIHGSDFSFINANTADPTKFFYLNYFQKVNKDGIKDTKTWLETSTDVGGNDFILLTAKDRLTDVKIEIDPVEWWFTLSKFNFADGYADVAYILKWGSEFATSNEYHFFDKHLESDGEQFITNDAYSYTIPVLEKGESIWLFNYMKIRKSSLGGAGSTQLDWTYTPPDNSKINISAIATGVDTVVKGVRLIDLLKHNVESISGLPLESYMYDTNSNNYDNFVFNGYLLARDNTKPFNNKFKELMNIPKELNADYQISTDKVEILPYKDFYNNIEIETLIELSNETNNQDFNKRYFLKEFEFSYKKSVVGRSTNITESEDDVHTDSQYLFPSKKTDGILKVEINHIRSSFLIEEQRLKLNTDRKSLENDENLFILDVVSLPENSRKQLTATLFINNYSLLSDDTFSWDLLGFNVGETIYINGVSNVVVSITDRLLIVSEIQVSGNYQVTIDYPLTNVTYMNRTSEGFSSILGIENQNNYSNLRYHIKRNLLTYESYLATAGKYLSNKSMQNTLFRVNDKLETKLDSEAFLVKDKGDIIINDIASKKILNPLIHNITVFCDFDKATEIFKKIENDKGFFRIQTIKNKIVKGFPIEATFEWKTNKLILKLEEKFESDFMTIDKVSDVVFVNEVGYEIKLGLNRYDINNNFVSLYDDKNIRLSNSISFENIKVNGIVYNDIILFNDALSNLFV